METTLTSCFVTAVLGYIVFYLVSLWIQIRKLPPGPLPIPFLGNLLMFRGDTPVKEILAKLKSKYGGLYTLWMAGLPYIIVADWERAKEALVTKRNDFLPNPIDNRFYVHAQPTSGIAAVNGPEWEVNRKIGANAIRKLADSETVVLIVKNSVNDFVKTMVNENEAFDPAYALNSIVIKIISAIAFGMDISEEDLHFIEKNLDDYHSTFFSMADLSPILYLIYYGKDLEDRRVFRKFGAFIFKNFQKNKLSFIKGKIRNFCDSILTSRLEALKDDEHINKDYLSENKIWKITGDLFVAGLDTSSTTIKWIVLLLATYPEMQQKITKEILQNIGDRIPTTEDKNNCPYTRAFISETLRFRAPAPMGVEHRASFDTTLDGYPIKKGTMVMVDLDAIQKDPSNWEEPEVFKPERFLNPDGTYNSDKLKGFIAFGQGKRMCLGEKMARNNIFLIMANLLQKIIIQLETDSSKADLEPDNVPLHTFPKSFKIRINRRKATM